MIVVVVVVVVIIVFSHSDYRNKFPKEGHQHKKGLVSIDIWIRKKNLTSARILTTSP